MTAPREFDVILAVADHARPEAVALEAEAVALECRAAEMRQRAAVLRSLADLAEPHAPRRGTLTVEDAA